MALPAIYLAASGNVNLDTEIDYPCFVSVKLDGVRAIILDGVMYSRKMLPYKPLVQKRFAPLIKACEEHDLVLDGELYNHEMTFQQITSATSHEESIGQLTFNIFDCVPRDEWFEKSSTPYSDRYARYLGFSAEVLSEDELDETNPCQLICYPVEQYLCKSSKEVQDIHLELLEEGYEGTMIRSPNGLYKHGRSTVKERDLRKNKPFVTMDAVIIGFEAKQRLTEEAKQTIHDKDAFGRSKRGHRKDDREPVNEIGNVVCMVPGKTYTDDKGEHPYQFKATWTKGSPVRTEITWENREQFIGKWVEIEYQQAGMLHLPRLPRIFRFRTDLDD